VPCDNEVNMCILIGRTSCYTVHHGPCIQRTQFSPASLFLQKLYFSIKVNLPLCML
jgi:hypothetical protein